MKFKNLLLIPLVFTFMSCGENKESLEDSIPLQSESFDESTTLEESTLLDNSSSLQESSTLKESSTPEISSTSEDSSSPEENTTPEDSNQDVHIHSYESIETKATCTESGYITYYCNCGDEYTQVTSEPLDHNFEDNLFKVIQNPTFYQTGLMYDVCSSCLNMINQYELPILSLDNYTFDYLLENECYYEGLKKVTYNFDQNIDVELLYESSDLPETHKYNNFNYEFDDQSHYVLSDCNHNYKFASGDHNIVEEVIKEATTSSQGIIKKYCNICGYYKEEIIPIIHEHNYSYENLGNNHKGVCNIPNCNSTIYEKCKFTTLYDDIRLQKTSVCEKCNNKTISNYENVGKLIKEYSVVDGKNVLTYYSNSKSKIDYFTYYDCEVVGDEISASLIDILVIGANISYVGVQFEYENIEKIVISEDVKEIYEWLVYNASNIKYIEFEGDAPINKANSIVINGGSQAQILASEGSVGFDSLLYCGIPVSKNFPTSKEFCDMSLEEYGFKTAQESAKMAKQLYDLAINKGVEEQLYYPFVYEIDQYEEIVKFTLELTKDCTTQEQKIRKIYEYIVDNVVYDDVATSYSSYEVLINSKAICSGYVTLMHDMLASVKIASFYSRGATLPEFYNNSLTTKDIISDYDSIVNSASIESHAWIAVILNDGSVAFYDPTWGVMDREYYYDMTLEELGNHAITYEIDFLEVYIDEINFTMLNSINQYLSDDGNVYVVDGGNIIQIDAGNTYNNVIGIGYKVATYNDGYVTSDGYKNIGACYNDGLIVYGGYLSITANYASYDSRNFDFKKYLKYINLYNKYFNENIKLDDYRFYIENDCVYYLNDNNTYSLYSYIGHDDQLTIPSLVNGRKVLYVAHNAFTDDNYLKTISFSEGIQEIQGNVFNRAKKLEVVNLPSTLKKFAYKNNNYSESGVSQNYCLNLKAYNIPESNEYYKSIDGVLYSKDMKQLIAYANDKMVERFEIPETVEYISSGAFSSAKIKEVIINDNLKKIDDLAFSYSYIEELTLNGNVELGYSTFANCCYLKEVTILEGMEILEQYTFANCQSLSKVNLPSSLKEISSCAFVGCVYLLDITIPEGVEVIGYMAFAETGLISITLPSTLVDIQPEAFTYCDKLYEIYNYSSLTLIANSYDYGSIAYNAKNIFIDNERSKIDIIDGFVFYEDTLMAYIGTCDGELVLPESYNGKDYVLAPRFILGKNNESWVMFGEEFAPWSYSMYHNTLSVTSVVIPSCIQSIPSLAFAGNCNITEITFTNSLMYFDMDCFAENNIKTVNFKGTEQEYYNGMYLSIFKNAIVNFID